MRLEERDIVKMPIAIDKASPDQKLDTMSRINFSRVHTVKWDVKVMNVGRVAKESMPRLLTYWKQNFE
jgi:mRNA-degrading endonuclease toxin of MazEF toxin-antitoxin module